MPIFKRPAYKLAGGFAIRPLESIIADATMAEKASTILADVEEFPLRLNEHSSDVSRFLCCCVYVCMCVCRRVSKDVFW